ncbi:SNF2-related protein, partial [bacterium]|nr:SNF2-related protein [bacterium]
MGLGKTIQVLSLLESRRTRKVSDVKSKSKNSEEPATVSPRAEKSLSAVIEKANLKRKPSIVVVPKSLIFNWIEEAAKFTPRLRLVNYTGTGRQLAINEALAEGGFDVLLTTYGTMRKDIAELSQIEFDYAILDESQAIKNSKAQCAKSSRLLRAEH